MCPIGFGFTAPKEIAWRTAYAGLLSLFFCDRTPARTPGNL
jgi:hypothetical protein